jgi:Lysozyme like domain
MPIISYKEMTDALRDAGFHGIQIPVMIAIALAESGGDSSTVGDTGKSYGLWQIYQPVWGKQYPVNCATNTKCAAKAAWEISQHGKSFNPWTVFRAAVDPMSLDPSLRANKFTNYLPQVLAYFGIPKSVDWQDELIKAGHDVFEKIGDVTQDIIEKLPEWAKVAADKVTPDTIVACGMPDATFDATKQAQWFLCIASASVDTVVPDVFSDLLPSMESVKMAVVVLALLGIGGVFIIVGANGLANKSDLYREGKSKAKETGKVAAMALVAAPK